MQTPVWAKQRVRSAASAGASSASVRLTAASSGRMIGRFIAAPVIVADYVLLSPAAFVQQLIAEQAQQHLIRAACQLGVRLKARALEVLHLVRLIVVGVDFGERLADWIAVDRQPAVLPPIAREGAAQRVAGRWEIDAIGEIRAVDALEGCLTCRAPGRCELVAEQAQQHLVRAAR